MPDDESQHGRALERVGELKEPVSREVMPGQEKVVEQLKLLKELGIDLVCSTAGSPYYNPHIQRPAIFPPSDGYLPPEDPLVGCVRQIQAHRQLKAAVRRAVDLRAARVDGQSRGARAAH